MAGMPAASTPLPDVDARLIDRFVDMLWMERGLSDLTLTAYRSDLEGWLSKMIFRLDREEALELDL